MLPNFPVLLPFMVSMSNVGDELLYQAFSFNLDLFVTFRECVRHLPIKLILRGWGGRHFVTGISVRTVYCTALIMISVFSLYNVDVHRVFYFQFLPFLIFCEAAGDRNFHFFCGKKLRGLEVLPNFAVLLPFMVFMNRVCDETPVPRVFF